MLYVEVWVPEACGTGILIEPNHNSWDGNVAEVSIYYVPLL